MLFPLQGINIFLLKIVKKAYCHCFLVVYILTKRDVYRLFFINLLRKVVYMVYMVYTLFVFLCKIKELWSVTYYAPSVDKSKLSTLFKN